MCGRIYQTLPLHRLVSIARARMARNPQAYTSSFNVCPTTFIPAIRSNKRFRAQQPPVQIQSEKENVLESQQKEAEPVQTQATSQKQKQSIAVEQSKQNNVSSKDAQKDDYELSFSKWGLKSKYNLITNCRVEQMFLKSSFTKIIQNRCVIIVQGYYEWNTEKEAHLFKNKTDDHLLVAGLFNQQNEVVILTRDSTANLEKVHHRMPVILSPEDVKLWLDPSNDKVIAKIVEEVFLAKEKDAWKNIDVIKLAPYINSIKQKSAKCIMTFEEYKEERKKNGIMKYFKKIEIPPPETVGVNGEVLVQPQLDQEYKDAMAKREQERGKTESQQNENKESEREKKKQDSKAE